MEGTVFYGSDRKTGKGKSVTFPQGAKKTHQHTLGINQNDIANVKEKHSKKERETREKGCPGVPHKFFRGGEGEKIIMAPAKPTGRGKRGEGEGQTPGSGKESERRENPFKKGETNPQTGHKGVELTREPKRSS